jgi:hypothetical protein
MSKKTTWTMLAVVVVVLAAFLVLWYMNMIPGLGPLM